MIRKMNFEDINRVLEIDLQGIEEGNSTFRQNIISINEWDNKFKKEYRYVWVEDGKIQGWIALMGSTKSPAYTGVCEISIYIDREYRGRKIGDQLLKKLVKESEKKKIWTLESQIFKENIASINLHKRNGFRIVGVREKIAKDKFGKWRDVVLLERRSEIIE